MKQVYSVPVAKEGAEQQALFRYCAAEIGRYPQLTMLLHIPNGGMRNKKEAAILKREGVRKGYPDLALDYSNGKYHGLRIELKRVKGSTISDAQKWWIRELNKNGYASAFCFGWADAWEFIKSYLDGDEIKVNEYIERSLKKAGAGNG